MKKAMVVGAAMCAVAASVALIGVKPTAAQTADEGPGCAAVEVSSEPLFGTFDNSRQSSVTYSFEDIGGQPSLVINRFELNGSELQQVSSAVIDDPGYVIDIAHASGLTVLSSYDKIVVVEESGLSQELPVPAGYYLDDFYSYADVSVLNGNTFAVAASADEAAALVYRKTAISTTYYWALTEVVIPGSNGEETYAVEIFDDEIWIEADNFYRYSFDSGEFSTVDRSFFFNARVGDYLLFYDQDWFAQRTFVEVVNSRGEPVASLEIEDESAELSLDIDGERYRLVVASSDATIVSYDLGTAAAPVAVLEPVLLFDAAESGAGSVYGLTAAGGNTQFYLYNDDDFSERLLLVPKVCGTSPLPAPDSTVVNPEPFDVSGASGPGNTFDYPWCLAQITGDAYCFDTSAARQSYIEGELIGHPEYGTIWIGRFDEEVVAP